MRQLIWFLIAMLAAGLAQAGEDYELRAEIPTDGLERLFIDAEVGEVVVTGTDTNTTITVSVTLEDDNGWHSDADFELLDDSVLLQKKSGSELRLRLKLPRGIDDDDIQERWDVTVPRSFAARVNMGVGTVDVTGISGGVNARVGVGTVMVEVPRGSIDARSGVGDVEVITETPSNGDIELDSNVGSVKLVLRGDRIRAGDGWGPGQSLEVEGKGEDRIEASAGVGSVRVRVE